ncbi:TM2 domain-containing protein 3 [Mactra antiquata]
MGNILYHICTLIVIVSQAHSDVNNGVLTTETPVEQSTSVINLPKVKESTNSNVTNTTTVPPNTTVVDLSYLDICPDNAPCENLGANCIQCKLNYYCVYGKIQEAKCTVKPNISCTGNKEFKRPYHCRYGYQLSKELVSCDIILMASKCSMKKSPPELYMAKCSVRDDVLCLGNRTFNKKFPCNWTSGYKWSTALALSVTLGGFGVDRFYLGLWRQGMGKLFSFGGLGVWTIVDVILIAVGYVGPHDDSLYIYPWD